MTELKEIDRALAEFLLDNVLKKQGNPTYKEVAVALSDRMGYAVNPHQSLF
ncbi:MAG: hypothetical protein RSE08_07315 [Lactococcus sp.]